MTPRMTSGSDRSASAVDPTTSQKTTVTVFLTSRDAAPAASGSPQRLQNRAPSGFSPPHRAHSITLRVYGPGGPLRIVQPSARSAAAAASR
jgi:hypothetical protein